MIVTWPIVRADELGTGDILDFGKQLSRPFWCIVSTEQMAGGVYVRISDGRGWQMGWLFDRHSIARKRLATP